MFICLRLTRHFSDSLGYKDGINIPSGMSYETVTEGDDTATHVTLYSGYSIVQPCAVIYPFQERMSKSYNL